jgi:transcriptional regulator with XRE-family HTH domain
MALGDSPTVARRRVRLALRGAREHGGLTQQQVADEMEWSLSKVIRIESGEVSIAPNDLRPLLGFLGIKDRSRIDALVQDARAARVRQRRSWWQEPVYREHLTPALRHLIEFEAEAVSIRYFGLLVMPGPIQIPQYAEALTRRWSEGEELTEDEIKFRVQARTLRRDTILSRLGSLRLFVLLDEAVLLRPIGGRDIFAGQLKELIRLGEHDSVSIRMIPFDVEIALSNNAAFDLLYLGQDGNDDDAIMYRETGPADEIIEDHTTAARHRTRYEKLWDAALDESATAAFIQERLDAVHRK